MVVFLEEFVFRLARFVVDYLRILLQLGLSLLFGHVVPSFELLFLSFTSTTGDEGVRTHTSGSRHSQIALFTIAFQPFEFAQFPGIVGSFGILVVRIEITLNTVVGFFLFDLFVSNDFFDDLTTRE